MAKSIKEIGKKAEALIEQGKDADKKIQGCQARVASASSRVAAARRQLATASETDEEGNPRGDVDAARAQLSMAQNQLAASQRALSSARSDSERVKQQKRTHISEIQKHNETEKSNLEKLRKLKSSAFGSDSAALSEGMARRLNEAEDSRVALLRSMGIDASPEYVSPNGDVGADSPWRGGGFGVIDTSGTIQHFQGGSSQSMGGNDSGNTTSLSQNDVSSLSGAGGKDLDREQNSRNDKNLLGRLFRKDKKNQNDSVDFNGFSLERNSLFGDRFWVKSSHYNEYCDFRQNYEDYERTDIKQIRTINARDIEGIWINESEAYDRHLFWNRGHEYPVDSELYFMEIATHIPEVRMRLDSGETVESIRNNPTLATCYDYYFDTPIRVYEVDGYYVFSDAGRHRCMAAQKLGYDIPVNVIGLYNRKNTTSVELEEISTHDSLNQYMSAKYDIQLDSSISNLNFDTVKGAISGVETVINDYPDVGKFLKSGITSSSGVMSCTGSKLSFNPDYFSDDHKLRETCINMSNRGFWVKNASPTSIGVHEAAHGIEWALIQANRKYITDGQRVSAWNNCTEAMNIVREACDNIKRTPHGAGKSSTELIRSISTYAMENDSETMAEAFADVYANGENAKPLSKEIKRLTQSLMNKYKGGI